MEASGFGTARTGLNSEAAAVQDMVQVEVEAEAVEEEEVAQEETTQLMDS